MHLLFDIFVLPPAVIAGVIFIATWNLCDAVIAFRVGFFMCPVCGLFILADRGPEGIALLFAAVVFAIFWSRVMRLPLGVDPPSPPPSPSGGNYQPPPPPPAPQPVPQLVRGASGVYHLPSAEPPRSMVITVARRPPRISEMQGGELWTHGSGGWQVEHVELT
jgi:hypothetical protein